MNIMKNTIIILILICVISITGCNHKPEITRDIENLFVSKILPLPDNFVMNRQNDSDYVISYVGQKLFILGYTITDRETFTTEPTLFIYDLKTGSVFLDTMINCNANASVDFILFDSALNRITIETVDYVTTLNILPAQSQLMVTENLSDIFKSQIKKMDTYDNKIYIASADMFAVFTSDGKLMNSIEIENSGYRNFYISETGDVILKYADRTGSKNYYKYVEEKNNKIKLGGDVNLISGNNYVPGTEIYDGAGYYFYYKDSAALYGYDNAMNKLTAVLDWNASDLNPESIFTMEIISPDTIIYFGYDNLENKENFVVLTRATEDMPIEKNTIELAHIGDMTDILNQAVINFNQTSNKYRIEVKNFSSDDKGYGYVDDFNLAISTGYVPDLILLNPFMPIQSYIRKGLLADIYPFIDNDPDIKRDDFYEFILDLYKQNDKLYQFNVLYSISTFAGKTKNIGSETKWSYKDFKELHDSLTEDQMLWSRLSPLSLMSYLYLFGITELIDFDNYTCNFEDADFIEAMEIIKSFKDESVFNMTTNEINEFFIAEKDMYRNDELILSEARFENMFSFLSIASDFNFEDITVKGSPSISGETHLISVLTTSFAVTEQSKVKDGAWQFLKSLVDDKFQALSATMNLPVTKSGLMRLYDKFTQSYYYIDNMGHITEEKFALDEDELLEKGLHEIALDEGFLYSVIDTLNSSKVKFIEDMTLINIVSGELITYLDTDVSAADTAKVIKSKVNIYLSEIKP